MHHLFVLVSMIVLWNSAYAHHDSEPEAKSKKASASSSKCQVSFQGNTGEFKIEGPCGEIDTIISKLKIEGTEVKEIKLN